MMIGKQQLQYLALAVLGVLAAVFLVAQFLVIPAWNEWTDNVAQAEILQKKLRDGRMALHRRVRLQIQIGAVQSNLVQQSANIPLPVLGNYLIQAIETIRQAARGLPVDALRVVEHDRVELGGGGGSYLVYRVRVNGRVGFHDLIRWMQNIESGNPLVSISGLTITARPEARQQHDVDFLVSWIIWADETKRPQFLLDEARQHSPPPES